MKIIFGRDVHLYDTSEANQIDQATALRLMLAAVQAGEELKSPSPEITSPEAAVFMEQLGLTRIGQFIHHDPTLRPLADQGETILVVIVSAWMGDRRLTEPYYIYKIVGE